MTALCTPFDPSATASGTITTNLGNNAGVLLCLNDSATIIKLQLGDGTQKILPAQTWRRIDLDAGNSDITWTQVAILPIAVPNSQVYIEPLTLVEAQDLHEIFPAAVVRAVTGNAIVATELVNVGNPTGTTIIESNASNSVGTNLFNNDGSRTVVLQDQLGIVTVESLVNGVGAGGKPAIQYGVSTDATLTSFFGELIAAISSIVSTQFPVQITEGVSGKTWKIGVDSSGDFLIDDVTDGNVWTFSPAGVLTLGGPLAALTMNTGVILRAAGKHQQGYASGGGKAVTAGDVWSFPIQYPMEGTNAASSITLTVNTSTNITSAVAAFINKFGFTLQLTATAAGAFQWNGTYATVGD